MIKNVRAPYGEVGKLESSWYPLVLDTNGRAVDPETDEGCGVDLPEIESPKVRTYGSTLSLDHDRARLFSEGRIGKGIA